MRGPAVVRTKWLASAVALAWVASTADACSTARATTVRLELSFDATVSCDGLRSAEIRLGRVGTADSQAPIATATRCSDAARGSIGSFVVTEGGATTFEVSARAVVAGLDPIEQRRVVSFASGTEVGVPIVFSRACAGVTCGEARTCAAGDGAVPACIDAACASPGTCPGGVGDAGADEGPNDAPTDAPESDAPAPEASDAGDAGDAAKDDAGAPGSDAGSSGIHCGESTCPRGKGCCYSSPTSTIGCKPSADDCLAALPGASFIGCYSAADCMTGDVCCGTSSDAGFRIECLPPNVGPPPPTSVCAHAVICHDRTECKGAPCGIGTPPCFGDATSCNGACN
jgi:hypothetical protein